MVRIRYYNNGRFDRSGRVVMARFAMPWMERLLDGRWMKASDGWPSYATTAMLYIVAYLVLDRISFLHPFSEVGITPWDPPQGLTLAVLLRLGLRWIRASIRIQKTRVPTEHRANAKYRRHRLRYSTAPLVCVRDRVGSGLHIDQQSAPLLVVRRDQDRGRRVEPHVQVQPKVEVPRRIFLGSGRPRRRDRNEKTTGAELGAPACDLVSARRYPCRTRAGELPVADLVSRVSTHRPHHRCRDHRRVSRVDPRGDVRGRVNRRTTGIDPRQGQSGIHPRALGSARLASDVTARRGNPAHRRKPLLHLP